jgi:dephospho-CoA kinase
MLRVGLTGGIGSGKSTVARLFARHGVPVLDADAIAHELSAPGAAAFDDIVRRFGREILDASGRIARSQLAQRVFADAAERRALEAILHPLIRRELQARSQALTEPYCVLVIPLLVESGQRDLVDRVLVVDCPEDEQLRRASARDGRAAEEVRQIMSAQATRAARLAAADDMIANDRDLDHLEREVERLHRLYLSLAA